jgi:hypothetical protein
MDSKKPFYDVNFDRSDKPSIDIDKKINEKLKEAAKLSIDNDQYDKAREILETLMIN